MTDEPVVSRAVPLDMSSWTNTVTVRPVPDYSFRPSTTTRSTNRIAFTGPLAEYEARFVQKIEQRWRYWLRTQPTRPQKGAAVIGFRLYRDGRVRDLKVESSTLDETALLICQKAILDGAPYEKYASPAPYRDVRFTFFHE